MDMYNVVSQHPILAIMRNIPPEDTIPYAEAIVRGGISFFEVALNSPHALDQITLLRKHFSDTCLIGAGTAITIDRCKAAMEAGAQFLLTPGTSPRVLDYCSSHNIPLLPGVLTPCDVSLALEYGYTTMKLFPAGSMPMQYVKDLKGPFDNTHYMAIGGVGSDNIRQFLDAGFLGVGLAGGLVPAHIVREKNWEKARLHIEQITSAVRKENRP